LAGVEGVQEAGESAAEGEGGGVAGTGPSLHIAGRGKWD